MTVDEQAARSFYWFIDARLDEGLRAQYDAPAVEKYREEYSAAKADHDAFADALHGGDQDRAEELLELLRNRASRWKAHAEYPEPPVTAEDAT
ncbi:hypothetical protein [Streptomyces longispororuber]|uniref:hypothetical protein n=1 Tax=Streptomyces longispororuber TaxID=68230 RepID=UPI0037023D6B